MKKKISLAAYLAGVTTLAVSLPAMADDKGASLSASEKAPVEASKILKTDEKRG